MKWVVIVVRTLVGALFVFSGVTGLFNLMDAQLPEGDAGTFGKVMMDTGYMSAVKVVELVGGLLLMSGRLAPLGITLLMPVAVNILMFEAFLARQPGPGVVLVPLLAFLIWGIAARSNRCSPPTRRSEPDASADSEPLAASHGLGRAKPQAARFAVTRSSCRAG